MATGGKRYLLRPVLRRRSISAPALCPPSCDDLAATSKISKGGALLNVPCFALGLALAAGSPPGRSGKNFGLRIRGPRSRAIVCSTDGIFESSFSPPACNRGCRILHARGRTFVCRLCAGYD